MKFRGIIVRKFKVILVLPICCTIYVLISGLKLHLKYSEKDFTNKKGNYSFRDKFNYSYSNLVYDNKMCFHLTWNFSDTNESHLADLATPKCKRFITIHESKGRIGNDMFQMAAVFAEAYRNDLIPVVPLNFPLLQYFDLPNVVHETSGLFKNSKSCTATPIGIYKNCSETYKSPSNVIMSGYFQSWRYFQNEDDIIRNVLRLKTKHLNKAREYSEKVNPSKRIQVCIHIRRGDFLTEDRIKLGYTVGDKHFIEKAQYFFTQTYSNVLFLVLSADKQWCKENLQNVTVSPFDDPGDDMALMAYSDHVIVTAGTFGWWGAWLSGGLSVYYNGFPRPDSHLDTKFVRYDYYPPFWIGF